MNLSHQLADVLEHDARLVLLPGRTELGRRQRTLERCLARHAYRGAVQKGALAPLCGKLLPHDRVVDDGNFRHLADEQCDRNAGVREAVHEVHRSIDRVDNPGRRVGQFGLLPLARFLLTDKPFKRGRYSFQN